MLLIKSRIYTLFLLEINLNFQLLKVNLPNKIKADINNNIQYDVTLYPIGNLIICIFIFIDIIKDIER